MNILDFQNSIFLILKYELRTSPRQSMWHWRGSFFQGSEAESPHNYVLYACRNANVKLQ